MHFAVSRYNPIFGKNFRPTLALWYGMLVGMYT